MRSIEDGEAVRGEEFIYPLADGSRLWLRCDSSPIYDDEGDIVAGVLVAHDITEQKRSEEQLAYHAYLLENTEDAVLASDDQAVLTAWNKGAEEMFGWRAEEVLGRKVYEVLPYRDYSDEQLAEVLRKLADTGQRRTEATWYRKDGAPVHAEALTVALRGARGGITGYLSIIRDISERKRTEEQLRESEERFRATFEQVAVGIGHINLEGHFIRLNQKFCEIVGYTQEELLQLTFRNITRSDDLDEDVENLRQLLAEEISTYSMEKRYIHKDGSIVWVDLTVSVVQELSGEPNYIIGVIEDISERKRTEESLRESSRQIEDILESITDAFYAVDHQWRFTYINDRALRYMQAFKNDSELTREELLGKNVWEEFPEAVSTVFYDRYHEALREQKVVDLEEYYPPNDVWLEVHAYPSEDGLSFYWRDITERKQVEKEIETRDRQQAAVADLGLTAVAGGDLDSLMDEVVACVARTLGVEYAKIVELLPGGEELLLRSGVGFEEGLVGRATEEAGLGSQAGYTLLSEEPVIAEDFDAETRFKPPPLVHERGAISGVSVVIQGRDGPFGVLGAFTTRHRSFSEDDANFLQAVANVLATAIEREGAEEQVEEGRETERSRLPVTSTTSPSRSSPMPWLRQSRSSRSLRTPSRPSALRASSQH